MTSFWKRMALALWLVPAGLLASCESKPAALQTGATAPAAAAAPADTTAAPAAAAAYICPMGCEGSASNTPGKCPVCEMDLEPNPAAKPATQL